MSDRLPIPARRSRGGKHVAPRTAATPVVPSGPRDDRTAARTDHTPVVTGPTPRTYADTGATVRPSVDTGTAVGVPAGTGTTARVSADTGATRAVLHRAPRARAHILPRGGSMSARVAQGAVVAVLAIGLGGTVTAAASAKGEEQQAALTAEADQATGQAHAAAHARAVDQAVGLADDAIEASTAAQTEGQQAAVDTARLAELQAATDRLEALVDALPEDVRPERERTSRAADRSGTEAPATTDEAAEPTPTATDPATQGTPGTTASPTPAATTEAPVERADVDDASPATIRDAAAEVSALTDEIRTTAEANRTAAAAAQAQADAEAAAAAEAARVAAEQAAQRAAWKQSLLGYANGKIPAAALCGVSWDSAVQLRCDAAEALEQLNAAYVAAFGTNMSISDSYRSYAGQVACRRTKGWLCATPGTSNHGTGVAIDFGGGIESFGTTQYAWMKSNADQFSWTHPSWAERGSSKPEAWHWEYVG
ncbi:D-alanyl-D-alanine carboxypeptidase family protein [Cellulomonas algicola]|uniref:D-alanyl-D-alanine carboxypeptidase family protein n=2 Tax=Cellulomonas algicola TaxID=2071633 RepID=UPI001C3FF22F|nr:D-alanyl-D-alanine carboxypeptidase family protein [Cellulomonas algicola]